MNPDLILVVRHRPVDLESTTRLLEHEGYRVIGVTSFQTARPLLRSQSPTILVADVRLGPFNGLHLAILSHFRHPDVCRTLLLDAKQDDVLEHDASRYGAVYLAEPADEALRDAVARIAGGEPVPNRRGDRRPVAGGLVAQIGALAGTIMNLSYGGLCFKVPLSPDGIPSAVKVNVPGDDVAVVAKPVWFRNASSSSSSSASTLCGATIGRSQSAAWRAFVDRVGATA